MSHKILHRSIINYYLIFCISSYIIARGFNLPLIVLLRGIILIAWFNVLTKKWHRSNSTGFFWLKAIFVSILLSCANYLYKDVPIDLLLDGILCYIYPVSFFFFAQILSKDDCEKFYQRTLYALMFTYIVGLYLYFFTPSWYMAWRTEQLTSWLGDEAENYITGYINLSSFFNVPYFVGYTSFWAISYLCNIIYKSDEKLTNNFIFLIISIAVLLLAQQRITVVLSIGLLFYYSILEISARKFRITYILIIIVLFVIYYVITYFSEIEAIISRYNTIIDRSILEDGRDEQWRSTYKTFNNMIIGEGFNIVGHKAQAYGLPNIVDGEFWKLFYELGFIGCFCFYSFCLLTVKEALKHRKDYMVEIPMLLGFIAMQYGANPFEMNNIIILYWFAAGLIWKNKKTNKYDKVNSVISSSVSSDSGE